MLCISRDFEPKTTVAITTVQSKFPRRDGVKTVKNKSRLQKAQELYLA